LGLLQQEVLVMMPVAMISSSQIIITNTHFPGWMPLLPPSWQRQSAECI